MLRRQTTLWMNATPEAAELIVKLEFIFVTENPTVENFE
jgi:hypothetical protein